MSKLEIYILLILSVNYVFSDYWEDRDAIVKKEETLMLGGHVILNKQETIANKILMGYKVKECEEGFNNPEAFLPAKHFFQTSELVKKSKLFQFIRKMPKGAALHAHDTALVSEEYLYNLTFRENLYACSINKRLRFKFMLHPNQDNTCNWALLSKLRETNPNYDEWVRSNLTMVNKQPFQSYPDINTVWSAMMETFATVEQLVTYKPVFIDYFYHALQEFYKDNVMYLEFRGILPTVYELDGSQYSPEESVGFYKEANEKFKKDYPDFLGARLIYAPPRGVNDTTVGTYIELFKRIRNKFPDFVAGFDLVGQEDLGQPLTAFISQLQKLPKDVNLFFHAGETNWYGTSTDLNLVDAILLGTKRIGHGFALIKHPVLMEMVKKRKIAIEVCPISNQVLKLVEDMRNHPASVLFAQGVPVVISNDDPSFWSVEALSYDFYMAFVGIASKTADLKLLKQLAKNSLLYSSLPDQEKAFALSAWEKRWDKFISNIID